MNLRNKLFTFLVLMVLCASPLMVVDLQESDAAGSYFKYTLTNGSGTAITVTAENAPLRDFDSDGYGPFNSFYAAFDSTNNNRMICHLNPNNLHQAITKTIVNGYESSFTAVDGTYSTMDSTLLGNANIMWCLPTIYWYVENGSMVLTNDPSKGDAFAHTINSKTSGPYNYLAIGVYEAYNSSGLLMSKTSVIPTYSTTLADFRTYANNVVIDTDGGEGQNGDAGLWNYYQFQLYRLCALTYSGDYDVQSKIGWGYSGNLPFVTNYSVTGNWDSDGAVAGNPGTDVTASSEKGVKLFIENAWGSLSEYVDDAWWTSEGLLAGQNSTNITSDDKNKIITGIKYGIDGWGSKPETANVKIWGMPTEGEGSPSSGTCDDFDSSNSDAALWVGGNFASISSSGISLLESRNSNASWCGSRLAFVFDADPAGVSTVTFDHKRLVDAGGDSTNLDTSMMITDTATYPDLNTVTVNPSIAEGWTHIGWEVDGVRYDIGSSLASTESHTAYSLWSPPQITITFMVEGKIHSTLQVPKGSVGVVYTPVMVEGVFAGWYYDDQFQRKYDATVPLDTDTTLHALGVPPLIFTSEPNAAANIQQVNSYGMFFFDATDSSGRYQIHWDFGDGNTSDEAIAYNTYTEPGLYTVTLTVTNIYGESATSTYEIDLRDGSATNDVKWFAIGALCVIAVGFVVRRIL